MVRFGDYSMQGESPYGYGPIIEKSLGIPLMLSGAVIYGTDFVKSLEI